jgi:hypothetical protein
MQFRSRIAIPAITAAAILGSGGIAYANVSHETPTPTPTITQPTATPTPTVFPHRRNVPLFCYYKSPNGVQGSIVEFNWDHERVCPVGFTPLTLRDLFRFFSIPFGAPFTER